MSNPNGYLVLRRHNLDDIPVVFCTDLDDAIEAANLLPKEIGQDLLDILDIDCSREIGVVVIAFNDGKPIKIVYDRLFD